MEDVWIKINGMIKGKGLKKYVIAQRMGISKQGFSAMQKHSPSVRSLKRIAEALNVQAKDFF